MASYNSWPLRGTTILLLASTKKLGKDIDLGQFGSYMPTSKLMPGVMRLGTMAVPTWNSHLLFTQSLAGNKKFCEKIMASTKSHNK